MSESPPIPIEVALEIAWLASEGPCLEGAAITMANSARDYWTEENYLKREEERRKNR